MAGLVRGHCHYGYPVWALSMALRKCSAENMSDFYTCQPTEMGAIRAINQNIHYDQ